MSNLTEKLDQLNAHLSERHELMMGKIDERTQLILNDMGTLKDKLDIIIARLGDIYTITSNNGGFDAAPIVEAIIAMRGEGVENTIHSINQSLWNIAGPAPGTNLTQLADTIAALGGGSSLLDLFNLWDPGAGMTPYNLLDAIYIALTNSGLTQSAANDILVRLIAQFDTSVVTPTMKDLLMTISAQQAQLVANTENQLNAPPPDCCAEPLTSTGTFYQDTTIASISPVTFATWPETPGGDFTSSYDITMDAHVLLHCTDWTAYRIYVASKADSFGVITGRGTRYPCNQWITLAIPEGIIGGAAFNVDRANALKVYICGVNDTGVCAGYSQSDYIDSTGWDTTDSLLGSMALFGDPVGAMDLHADSFVTNTGTTIRAVVSDGVNYDYCFAWQGAAAQILVQRFVAGDGGVYSPIGGPVTLNPMAEASGEMVLNLYAAVFVVYSAASGAGTIRIHGQALT
jgi:hypothetical protein